MFVVILLPYLFAEIYLSLKMLELIGAGWATLWTIATMVLGGLLLKNTPFAMIGNLSALQRGKLDLKRFHDAGMAYFLGALLLIVPGVLSDFLGIAALLYTLYLQFVATITPEQKFTQEFHSNEGEDDVIDVEIVDERADSDSRLER